MGVEIGDRVEVQTQDQGTQAGIVKFKGNTHFTDEVVVGVVLDDKTGKHNGTIKGVMYFPCEEGHGICVVSDRVKKIPSREEDRKIRPEKDERRGKVLQEIVDTETAYVKNMTQLLEVYFAPLMARKTNQALGIMSHPKVAVICSNAEQLVKLNVELLKALQARLQAWDPKKPTNEREPLGDLFLKYAPLLELYGRYASDYHDASHAIREHGEAHPELLSFLQEGREKCKMNLESLLIMPVQRVPRYILLLKEVANCIPPAHPDYNSLYRALGTLSVAAASVNESIRRSESEEKLLDIQGKFVDNPSIVTAGRLFIKEGFLKKVSRGVTGNQNYYFLLCSDCLMYASKGVKGLSLHRSMPTQTTSASPTSGKSAIFSVKGEKSFEVLCKDDRERDEWITAINDAAAAVEARELQAKELAEQQKFLATQKEQEKVSKENVFDKDRKKNKRFEVASEINESEQAYVASIAVLLEVFIRPLNIKMKHIKQVPANFAIFCNSIEQIYTLNTKLHKDLSLKLESWHHQQTLGEIFVQFGPLLKIYSQYGNTHGDALATFNTKTVHSIVQEIEQDPRCKGMTLQKYMVIPMERVPRYEVLLKDLANQTQKYHQDSESLQDAITAVNEAVVHIKEAMKISTQLNDLFKIEQRFTEEIQLAAPHRVFLKEGRLEKAKKLRATMYVFFLFSDLLMYGEESGPNKHLKLHRSIELTTISKVYESKTRRRPSLGLGSKKADADSRSFTVESTAKSIILTAKSKEEMEEWMEAINKARDGVLMPLPGLSGSGNRSASSSSASSAPSVITSTSSPASAAFLLSPSETSPMEAARRISSSGIASEQRSVAVNKTCCVDGCKELQHMAGFCSKHFAEQKSAKRTPRLENSPQLGARAGEPPSPTLSAKRDDGSGSVEVGESTDRSRVPSLTERPRNPSITSKDPGIGTNGTTSHPPSMSLSAMPVDLPTQPSS